VTAHKNEARVAVFSPDGALAATGSADTSVKLLHVERMKSWQATLTEAGNREIAERPVLRTLYDHTAPVSTLAFHPSSVWLVSGGRDCTIKWFDARSAASMDVSDRVAKRAVRSLRESSNVRSIAFHPSGDYMAVATDHPTIRLYDSGTFACFATREPAQAQHTAAVTEVSFSAKGDLILSSSKDGSVKLWDGVSGSIVRTITEAHGGAEVCSARFSRDAKSVLTAGKDGFVRIWDTASGRELRAPFVFTSGKPLPQRIRRPATFAQNEELVVGCDEAGCAATVWDTRSGTTIQRLTGHQGIVRWVTASPTEPALITCGADFRCRLWVDESRH
jgi:cleavage stimulation factor subunit 1